MAVTCPLPNIELDWYQNVPQDMNLDILFIFPIAKHSHQCAYASIDIICILAVIHENHRYVLLCKICYVYCCLVSRPTKN